jgi:DNA-binding transcriptional regulator YbjK
VLLAAERVISRDGLGAVSVRSVAAEAEVSVGTVMYHFDGGLDQVRQLALIRVMEALIDRRLKLLIRPGSLASKLAAMIEIGVPDTISTDLRSVYASLPQAMDDPHVAAAHRDLVQRQVALYQQLLEVGVETGELADSIAVEDVARNIVALEDAYDLYPLIGLDLGGGARRRALVRGYVESALGVSLP